MVPLAALGCHQRPHQLLLVPRWTAVARHLAGPGQHHGAGGGDGHGAGPAGAPDRGAVRQPAGHHRAVAAGLLVWVALYHLGDAVQAVSLFMQLPHHAVAAADLRRVPVGLGLTGGYRWAFHGLGGAAPVDPAPTASAGSLGLVALLFPALLVRVTRRRRQRADGRGPAGSGARAGGGNTSAKVEPFGLAGCSPGSTAMALRHVLGDGQPQPGAADSRERLRSTR